MKILISSCLLGENCRYDGSSKENTDLKKLLENCQLYPVCPEVLGGLPTPRYPSEIKDGKVINSIGQSLDKEFRSGAQKALEIARENNIDLAILQSRSPSCGVKDIYDGSFTGRLIAGRGIFAEKLIKEGFTVVDGEDLDKIERILLNLK